ncbi:MAG: hypothetical protein C0401_11095 [Anaerolinea sp.]|nr:hypothetical protein [Anaerolinea sp.]
MRVLIDIHDTGWSTTKMWGNLLPYVSRGASTDLKVMLGSSPECQGLKSLLQSARVSCVRRFPWPDFRPARIRWRIEDALFVGCRWIYDAHVFHSSTVRVPTFGKWKKCITLLDTIRELYPEQFGEANHTILRMRKYAVQECDGILTISEYSKSCIVSIFGVSPQKVFVSHLAVNQRPIWSCQAPDRVNQALPAEPFVLYVGTRAGYKNFLALAYAFADNNLRELSVVAIGGGELTDVGKSFLKKLGILEKVHVFDNASEEFLHNAYKRATALVFPSKLEGFGLPILEAQAAGCPVIASNAGPLPEVAGTGAMFFDPDDYFSLASLIDHVCKTAVRNQLVTAGYANLSRFSWERSAQSIIQMYQA